MRGEQRERGEISRKRNHPNESHVLAVNRQFCSSTVAMHLLTRSSQPSAPGRTLTYIYASLMSLQRELFRFMSVDIKKSDRMFLFPLNALIDADGCIDLD